ncbi:MAG: type II secretion system F family protein [Candidatus Omnitrophica bacterium]|nr:type II secretion system F family protein [Candidatus Omnitrophota bacterium]
MLKFLILIFISGSLILLGSSILSLFLTHLEKIHKKRLEETVNKLETLFVDVEKKKLSRLFLFTPVGFSLFGFLILRNLLGVIIGLILGLSFPTLVVKNIEKRRKKKFRDQLIDALLLISNSLKSGLSFLQAIEVVVEEMPPPISQGFKILLNENKMGLPFEESLQRLNKKMYSEELNLMVTSILVARETGGDLSRIFERLVYTLRQKNKILRQIETLTLQARLQGMIMMVLPIIFAFGITQVNPRYFDTMLHSEIGRFLLLYAVFSQIIGMFLIRRLSKLEV